MRLIGINGLQTAGKDTAFTLIKQIQEQGVDDTRLSPHLRAERRGFADNLKIIAALALGYEGTDEELIALMNDFKENGHLNAQFNLLGGNGPLDTIMSDSSRLRIVNGRQYLQNLGANARKVFGEDFWVDQVAPLDGHQFTAVWETVGRPDFGDQMRHIAGLPAIGVITDVRYPNEAERVRQVGGEIWEIVRPGLESDGHSSEQTLDRDLVDRIIDNDGTIADFRDKLYNTLYDL